MSDQAPAEMHELYAQYGRAVFEADRWRSKRESLLAAIERLRPESEPVSPSQPVPIHLIYLNPPYGIFSRIGRKVGVSPSFARKVALGLCTSRRVAECLIEEAMRIEQGRESL